MLTPRRDLRFGSADGEVTPSGAGRPPAQTQSSPPSPELTSSAAAPTCAGASSRRAVSFRGEPQVLLPREYQQQGDQTEDDEQGEEDGGQLEQLNVSDLPDGITAIHVADPEDPNMIVMQVRDLLDLGGDLDAIDLMPLT